MAGRPAAKMQIYNQMVMQQQCRKGKKSNVQYRCRKYYKDDNNHPGGSSRGLMMLSLFEEIIAVILHRKR